MYELLHDDLKEIYEAGRWNSRKRFVEARARIRQKLEAVTPGVVAEVVHPIARVPEEANPLEMVCTVPEAAERLSVSEVTVRRRIYTGKLTHRKSGGVWLVLVPTE